MTDTHLDGIPELLVRNEFLDLLPLSNRGFSHNITDVWDKVLTTVVDNGPSVVENCSFQLVHHFPHLPHVLVIYELVKFWDKFRSEKGAV